jgi:hypothetical protein
MESDCINYVRRCPECQFHANFANKPATDLHGMTSPWPFSAWGLDIMGKIHPSASNGHEFILVAIDYFSKWIEAESFRTVKTKQAIKFSSGNTYSVVSECHPRLSQIMVSNLVQNSLIFCRGTGFSTIGRRLTVPKPMEL